MDKLQEYELYAIYDNIEYADFNLREMARLICYVTAQVQSSKKLTPQELWSLPWDKDEKLKREEKPMTKEDLQRKSKMESILQKIKNGELQTNSIT